jgi:hypothetical protein
MPMADAHGKNEEVRAAQDFAGFDFSENYVTIYKTRLY